MLDMPVKLNINGYETKLLLMLDEVAIYRTCEVGRGRYFLVCFGQPTVLKNQVGTINEITKDKLAQFTTAVLQRKPIVEKDMLTEISRLYQEASHAYAKFHASDIESVNGIDNPEYIHMRLDYIVDQFEKVIARFDDKQGYRILVNMAMELGKLRYMIDNTVHQTPAATPETP